MFTIDTRFVRPNQVSNRTSIHGSCNKGCKCESCHSSCRCVEGKCTRNTGIDTGETTRSLYLSSKVAA